MNTRPWQAEQIRKIMEDVYKVCKTVSALLNDKMVGTKHMMYDVHQAVSLAHSLLSHEWNETFDAECELRERDFFCDDCEARMQCEADKVTSANAAANG